MMEFILTESEFNEDNTAWNGNRFLMGNGYFGIRGTLEEYTKKYTLCLMRSLNFISRSLILDMVSTAA